MRTAPLFERPAQGPRGQFPTPFLPVAGKIRRYLGLLPALGAPAVPRRVAVVAGQRPGPPPAARSPRQRLLPAAAADLTRELPGWSVR